VIQNQITIKHNDRAYRKYRKYNRSEQKIVTRTTNGGT